MLKLNGIPEKRMQDNVEWTRELLGELLGRSVAKDEDALQSFHESAGRLSMQLGLQLYALESEPDEVREAFIDAAKHFAPALSLRSQPDPETHRSPWEAELFINVIACFGDEEEWTTASRLKPWQYCSPMRPDRDAVVRYLKVLLKYMGGKEMDTAALGEVIEACKAPNAAKEERLFLLPSARGLVDVEKEDEDDWNYAIAQIVAAHAREARNGDLKLLPEGLISFRALMLAKFGIDQEMECRAESDYLPLFLLESEEPA